MYMKKTFLDDIVDMFLMPFEMFFDMFGSVKKKDKDKK